MNDTPAEKSHEEWIKEYARHVMPHLLGPDDTLGMCQHMLYHKDKLDYFCNLIRLDMYASLGRALGEPDPGDTRQMTNEERLYHSLDARLGRYMAKHGDSRHFNHESNKVLPR